MMVTVALLGQLFLLYFFPSLTYRVGAGYKPREDTDAVIGQHIYGACDVG